MLTSVLKLLSAAQLGHAAKQAAQRACIQAAVFACIVLLFLAGIVFALIAAYFWLTTMLAPAEAAGILAAVLIISGLAVLAVRSLVAHWTAEPRKPQPSEPAAAISQTAADVTAALGPAQVITLALVAGIAAGRSLGKS